MFLLLWYSPPQEFPPAREGYIANAQKPNIVYVYDQRRVEDEEILLLKP